MTRALIDIPENALQSLTMLAKKRRLSRSSLIRAAIEEWLAKQSAPKEREAAFGILKNHKLPDGVELQRKLRSEW